METSLFVVAEIENSLAVDEAAEENFKYKFLSEVRFWMCLANDFGLDGRRKPFLLCLMTSAVLGSLTPMTGSLADMASRMFMPIVSVVEE